MQVMQVSQEVYKLFRIGEGEQFNDMSLPVLLQNVPTNFSVVIWRLLSVVILIFLLV